MATLIAIAYPDETTAEQARQTVQGPERELIVQADQVAAISRDQQGKYHVTTTHGGASTAGGAAWGGFWGLLFGLPSSSRSWGWPWAPDSAPSSATSRRTPSTRSSRSRFATR